MFIFSVRTLLLFLTAGVIGVVVFILAYFASQNRNVAAAVLVGGAAAGSTLVALNTLLGNDAS